MVREEPAIEDIYLMSTPKSLKQLQVLFSEEPKALSFFFSNQILFSSFKSEMDNSTIANLAEIS